MYGTFAKILPENPNFRPPNIFRFLSPTRGQSRYIQMWRIVLRTSWTHTRWLQTPCRTLLLLLLLLRRCLASWGLAIPHVSFGRNMHAEHLFALPMVAPLTAASASHSYPGFFWGSTSISHITTFVNNTGSVTPLDINVIEFTAAVILTLQQCSFPISLRAHWHCLQPYPSLDR